jgi:hypothetical protein
MAVEICVMCCEISCSLAILFNNIRNFLIIVELIPKEKDLSIVCKKNYSEQNSSCQGIISE